jgi:hypothetical protein
MPAQLKGRIGPGQGKMGLEEMPGGDLVRKGLRDLEQGHDTVEALLVSIAAPRLRASGVTVPNPLPEPEHRLYKKLAQRDPDSAHSRYNALLRRLTSFESAYECVG